MFNVNKSLYQSTEICKWNALDQSKSKTTEQRYNQVYADAFHSNIPQLSQHEVLIYGHFVDDTASQHSQELWNTSHNFPQSINFQSMVNSKPQDCPSTNTGDFCSLTNLLQVILSHCGPIDGYKTYYTRNLLAPDYTESSSFSYRQHHIYCIKVGFKYRNNAEKCLELNGHTLTNSCSDAPRRIHSSHAPTVSAVQEVHQKVAVIPQNFKQGLRIKRTVYPPVSKEKLIEKQKFRYVYHHIKVISIIFIYIIYRIGVFIY